MFICNIPNSASSRGRVIKVHTHARLLRTLPGEDVDGRGLSDISSSINYFVAALVHGVDFDCHIAIVHASIGDLDTQGVAREGHTDKFNVIICQLENVIWAITLKQSIEDKLTQ